MEFNSWLYPNSLHRAIYYYPFIVSIWFKYCWKRGKTQKHHHHHYTCPSLSKHTTSHRRHYNVAATSWRCSDVVCLVGFVHWFPFCIIIKIIKKNQSYIYNMMLLKCELACKVWKHSFSLFRDKKIKGLLQYFEISNKKKGKYKYRDLGKPTSSSQASHHHHHLRPDCEDVRSGLDCSCSHISYYRISYVVADKVGFMGITRLLLECVFAWTCWSGLSLL